MLLNLKTYKFFRKSFLLFFITSVFFSLSCSNKVAYLKKGVFIKPNIWELVEIDNDKVSADQKKIISEDGNPSYILTFLEINSEGEKGRLVHEWVYEKQEKFFWFVNGNLTDYIPVKPPKEKRIKIPGT